LQYVEQNIGSFHQKRIDSLNRLKLNTVLRKKNPYLFKAKYLLTTEQIIRSLTDAFISSNEETIFGDWLEGLAIFINQKYMMAANRVYRELIWNLTERVFDT